MNRPTPGSRPSEGSPEKEPLTQEEINERLRLKRKSRGQKACYPCRQRKVGCNYAKPCQKCIDRDHPELCLYEPVSKRTHLTPAEHPPLRAPQGSAEPIIMEDDGVTARLSAMEDSLRHLRDDVAKLTSFIIGSSRRPMRDPVQEQSDSEDPEHEARGLHTSNAMTGETVHLGGNSVPAMVLALGGGKKEDDVQGLLGKSILPIFGLDNESATYPFVDLWGLPHGSYARLEGLCKLLPTNADCLQYFKQYRDTAYILFPAVVDIHQFESDLTHFLIRRGDAANTGQQTTLTVQDVYGKSLHWSVILNPGVDYPDRTLVCCAYECLRIVNYLSNPTLTDIQSMLVLGNVISNNMNAGVAWSFLGLTIRLGQSLGLHQRGSRSGSDSEAALREEIWWRIVWQDSLLSITYDRASSTPTISHHKSDKEREIARLPYVDCMKILCSTGLSIVRERTHHSDFRLEMARIDSHRRDIEDMMEHAVHHLNDASACMSIKDQLEYWNLYMHRSYILAELYRSALRRKGTPPELIDLRASCIGHLADTVEAWLGLQNVTRFATQSWAAIHRSLSSALLLGILKQPQENHRVRILLDKLIQVMSSINSSSDPTEISAPIARAVVSLSRLNTGVPPEIAMQRSMTIVSGPEWEASHLTADALIYGELPIEKKSSSEGSPYEVMEKILWNPI